MEPFTYAYYETVITELQAHDYEFVTYGDTEAILDPDRKCVVLRHDVDISPLCIPPIMRIEHRNNAVSTYFFMVSSPLYNPFDVEVVQIVHTLRAYGNQIGLHFNFLDGGLGDDYTTLSECVLDQLALFERAYGFNADIVGYHSPPNTGVNSVPIPVPHNFDGFYANNLYYMGDSKCVLLHDFIDVIGSGAHPKIQLLTHPVWWSDKRNTPFLAIRRALALTSQHTDEWLENNFKIFRSV